MIICFKLGGQEHCYDIPVIEIPLGPHRPGPGPVNYPQLLRDATILASLQAAAQHVSDAGVRDAVHSGIKTAVEALQRRGGAHISAFSEDGGHSPPSAPTGGRTGPTART
jgi:hypothetical protein